MHRDLCVGGCGKERPEHAHKHGWRRGYCYSCYCAVIGYKSTDATRRYRSDPEKAERSRETSRAWKERNRERNRQRDRERAARKRREAAG